MTDVADLGLGDLWACASEEALQRATDLARRVLRAPAAMISSFEGDAQVIRCASGFARPPEPPFGKTACRSVLETGCPRVVFDVTADDREVGDDPAGPLIVAYIGVPIRLTQGRDIGTLCVIDTVPHSWSDDDLELLLEFAAVVRSQIELRLEAARHETPAAGVDRQLRAPLHAIIGLTDFLQTEKEPGLVSTHARNIRAAADAMLTIVGQFPSGDNDVPPIGEAPSEGPTLSAPRAPAPVRVLLADDLDLNRKLIADMLGLEGYVVDCVADGAEAVQAVTQRSYDLVLMDMIMPGMDGITATRAIRALPGAVSKVPILALTANSFREQLDVCLSAGMDATLTKPMSMEALTSAVSSWTRDRNKAA